jgi:hypothetical protein
MPPPAESIHHQNAPAGSGANVALIAVIAFVFGVLLNGYIALSVLDNGSSTPTPSEQAPIIVPAGPTTVPTATLTPQPDRTNCDEIRGTDYRSGAEREFFLANCINQPEPSPTLDATQLPPLDGGANTEAVETVTPTPEP